MATKSWHGGGSLIGFASGNILAVAKKRKTCQKYQKIDHLIPFNVCMAIMAKARSNMIAAGFLS